MIKNLRVPVFILSAMLLSASNAGAQYKAVVKSAPTGAAAFAGASFGMTPAVGAPLATGVLPTLSGSFVPTNPVVAAADFHAAVLQSGAATTPQRASALTGASKNAGSAAVTAELSQAVSRVAKPGEEAAGLDETYDLAAARKSGTATPVVAPSRISRLARRLMPAAALLAGSASALALKTGEFGLSGSESRALPTAELYDLEAPVRAAQDAASAAPVEQMSHAFAGVMTAISQLDPNGVYAVLAVLLAFTGWMTGLMGTGGSLFFITAAKPSQSTVQQNAKFSAVSVGLLSSLGAVGALFSFHVTSVPVILETALAVPLVVVGLSRVLIRRMGQDLGSDYDRDENRHKAFSQMNMNVLTAVFGAVTYGFAAAVLINTMLFHGDMSVIVRLVAGLGGALAAASIARDALRLRARQQPRGWL